MWKAPLDALMHPDRYAITPGAAQSPSIYIARVAATDFQPQTIQYDASGSGPVIVTARRNAIVPGARPDFMMVYFDPPTGRVLDVVDPRTSMFGLLHRFHENLTIPDYNGRAIVGWTGVAMLASVLTGVYLWWPRRGGMRRGLRWRRSPSVLSNLHHTVGIWIAAPLAVVALTGVYLAFPQQSRSLLASFFSMAAGERGARAAPLLQHTARSVDQALDAALTSMPDARPVTISLPTWPQAAWRIELHAPDSAESLSLLVDDASGAVKSATLQLSGDRVAAWLRWIHEGSHAGSAWRVIVFLCGLSPPLLGLSGVTIWLRRRSLRKRKPSPDPPERLGPAE